jgi:hypothetical protein
VAIRNLQLSYRPLQGGIAIFNPAVGSVGTLGLIVARGGANFILSAAHVLVANPGSPLDVFQPVNSSGATAVATVATADVNAVRDAALARIDGAVVSLQRVAGFGPVAATKQPAVGMEVIKVGASSGVTEGVITKVSGAEVEVRARADAPSGYNVCDPGDSGSVWIEIASRAPIALHTRGSFFGPETSFSTALHDLLAGWGASPC